LPLLADAILAIRVGKHAGALELLERFENELPPGPIGIGGLVPVRQPRTQLAYWRGQAQLAAGNLGEAATNMGFVANAKFMRLFMPIEHIRSQYYMGQIAEKQGDAQKAREYYARFLKYWKDGEFDRDKVAHALKKIGS
jgi:tetratricopeptide (TPR) repeat protein